jgi:hypothetical protein
MLLLLIERIHSHYRWQGMWSVSEMSDLRELMIPRLISISDVHIIDLKSDTVRGG